MNSNQSNRYRPSAKREFTIKTSLGMTSQRADVYLVRKALAVGYTIDVDVEGELMADNANNLQSVFQVLNDVDAATLLFRDASGKKIGTAEIYYDFGQSPDETVSDYSQIGFVADTMYNFYNH